MHPKKPYKIITQSEYMKIIKTHSQCTHFVPWAKMFHATMSLWDVHILNTPPSCIAHCLLDLLRFKNFSHQKLCLLQIPGWNSSCASHTCLYSPPMYTNPKPFCFVPTATIFSSLFATLSCIQNISSVHVLALLTRRGLDGSGAQEQLQRNHKDVRQVA